MFCEFIRLNSFSQILVLEHPQATPKRLREQLAVRRERRVAATVRSRLRGLRFLQNNAKDRHNPSAQYCRLPEGTLGSLRLRFTPYVKLRRQGSVKPRLLRLRDPRNMKGHNLSETQVARVGGSEYSPRLLRLSEKLAVGQSSNPSGSRLHLRLALFNLFFSMRGAKAA